MPRATTPSKLCGCGKSSLKLIYRVSFFVIYVLCSVGNFIKRWLSEHFQDFRGNEMLIDRLAAMAKQTFLVNEKSLGEKILSTLEEQRQRLVDANIGRASNKTTRSDHPDPILPKSMNFNDFDAIELARQLSLYEQSIYKQIHPKECLDQCWSKKDRYSRAPNVMRLIDLFNQCASWVASTIVRQNKLEGMLIRRMRLRCCL